MRQPKLLCEFTLPDPKWSFIFAAQRDMRKAGIVPAFAPNRGFLEHIINWLGLGNKKINIKRNKFNSKFDDLKFYKSTQNIAKQV